VLSGAVAGTSYVHGADGLIAKVNDTWIYYYHSDNLGSTSVITDYNGKIVEEQVNAPFGELISGSERYGFTGKELDETELQYFGARYYSPLTGRFLTVDPVKDGVNWYSYANNNPLRYIDPDGMKPILIGLTEQEKAIFDDVTTKELLRNKVYIFIVLVPIITYVSRAKLA